VSGGATFLASPSQQLLESTACFVCCGAAPAASVVAVVPAPGTDTETSTLAVETEMSTVPVWTVTETLGMLTLT
jgi:hypothetical protein